MQDRTISTMNVVHHRLHGTYRALCGEGYDWPSTILFSKEGRSATCAACMEIWKNDASGRGRE